MAWSSSRVAGTTSSVALSALPAPWLQEKKLEINGVGYRVASQGADLKFNLGFSHDVIYKVPSGINVAVDQNIITVSGISKQQVGQVAAEIRALKKPEPYKGKGIRYADEVIILKETKKK